MEYDDGEVLPGLNENWTFLGATAFEWALGIVVFVMISIFAPPGRIGVMVPFMLAGWVATTYSFASVRQLFPDEERGVANTMMTFCGFEPLNIPAPSALQPIWSGAPAQELKKDNKFNEVGLDAMFPVFHEQLTDDEEES